jgi:hypothetical protein
MDVGASPLGLKIQGPAFAETSPATPIYGLRQARELRPLPVARHGRASKSLEESIDNIQCAAPEAPQLVPEDGTTAGASTTSRSPGLPRRRPMFEREPDLA